MTTDMKKTKIKENEKYWSNIWTKKLFVRQPFPDNYVDETTFLSRKRINGI